MIIGEGTKPRQPQYSSIPVDETNTFDAKPYQFKLHDRVSFGGLEGTVGNESTISVRVDFADHTSEYFSLDGRFHNTHTTPLLVLIESAPKKKRKVTRRAFVNLYRSGGTSGGFETRAAADESATSTDRAECREITWEVELEVDDDAG